MDGDKFKSVPVTSMSAQNHESGKTPYQLAVAKHSVLRSKWPSRRSSLFSCAHSVLLGFRKVQELVRKRLEEDMNFFKASKEEGPSHSASTYLKLGIQSESKT